MNVEQKLSLNKFVVDEGNPHIIIHPEVMDEATKKVLTIVCPAGLYTMDEKGQIAFDYAGCLECGTCRFACGDTIIKKWENPQPTMGVEYRFG